MSFLFFRAWIPWLLFLGGLPLFLKDRKRQLVRRRGKGYAGAVSDRDTAGVYVSSGRIRGGERFREALKELKKIYSEESFIVSEFTYLTVQTGLNRSIESLLEDLGERSRVEDIRNFAEVFYTAKRTGGDLMAIMRNTISSIQQRQETRMEIETTLAGKMMEQNMMSAIPMLILGVRFPHLAGVSGGDVHQPGRKNRDGGLPCNLRGSLPVGQENYDDRGIEGEDRNRTEMKYEKHRKIHFSDWENSLRINGEWRVRKEKIKGWWEI